MAEAATTFFVSHVVCTLSFVQSSFLFESLTPSSTITVEYVISQFSTNNWPFQEHLKVLEKCNARSFCSSSSQIITRLVIVEMLLHIFRANNNNNLLQKMLS